MLFVNNSDEVPIMKPRMMMTTLLRNEKIFVENFFFTALAAGC